MAGRVPPHLDHHGPIRQREVLALPHRAKTLFLPHPHRILPAEAGEARHGLDKYFLGLHRADIAVAVNLRGPSGEICRDGFADVCPRFFACRTLRAAAGQRIAPEGPPFGRLHEGGAVFPTRKLHLTADGSCGRSRRVYPRVAGG